MNPVRCPAPLPVHRLVNQMHYPNLGVQIRISNFEKRDRISTQIYLEQASLLPFQN